MPCAVRGCKGGELQRAAVPLTGRRPRTVALCDEEGEGKTSHLAEWVKKRAEIDAAKGEWEDLKAYQRRVRVALEDFLRYAALEILNGRS